MNRAEFIEKWEHMFKLIEDRDLFPEYSSEDLPVLMLRVLSRLSWEWRP